MSRDVTQSESCSVTDGRGAAERHPRDVRFRERARILAAEAREARELFEPSPSSVASRRALEYACDGVGLAASSYVGAWADDRQVSFTGEEFELLHRAISDWLTMCVRCCGVDLDVGLTVRKAAEVLLRTHDVVDTAQLLTCAPERR